MSENKKTKSWIKRAYDCVATLSVIVLLTIFLINQVDQFMDRRSGPVVVHAQDGVRCVHYRGSIGCVQVFKGVEA